MSRQVFINLPVADVGRSIAFFEALGFSRNPQFSGEDAGCITISDAISVMLGSHAKFREFTPKDICDTSKAVEVLLNLSCESQAEVDSLVAKALAAGGSTYDKAEDFGFMYTHSFLDLDGHGWGIFCIKTQPGQEGALNGEPASVFVAESLVWFRIEKDRRQSLGLRQS